MFNFFIRRQFKKLSILDEINKVGATDESVASLLSKYTKNKSNSYELRQIYLYMANNA